MAARCHGTTAVVSGLARDWATELGGRIGRSVDPLEPERLASDRVYRTVIVADLLERVNAEDRAACLADAWGLVATGGRLVAVVSNGDCQPHRAPGRLKPGDVRKLLRHLGRPIVLTSQPFAWIVMEVRKSRTRPRTANRTRTDRFRATARLCRGRVLELGCGEGALTRVIHDRGHDIVGVDMNAEKIRRARAACPGATFIARNILDLVETGEFDTVVLAEVLEHVTDRVGNAILDRAWELVAQGGWLIVSVPNGHAIPHPNHIRQFDADRLAAMLRRFGRPRLSSTQPYKWLLMRVRREPA